MKKIVIGALAFVAIGAAPGLAADLPARTYTKAPVMVEPVYNWTGFYIGGNAGYGWMNSSDSLTGLTGLGPGFVGTELPSSLSVHPKGFIGGGQAGYNFQAGNLIYGFETDISFTDFHNTVSGLSPNGDDRTLTADQKLNLFGTVRGRVGVALTDQMLAYLTGGFAYGQGKLSTAVGRLSGCAGNNCQAGSASSTMGGWTIGGGSEYAFARNWSLGAEYLYFDLGSISHLMTDPNFPATTFSAKAPFRGSIARLALNYRY